MRILIKLLLKLAMFAAIVMLSARGLRMGAGLFTGGSGSAGNLGADGASVTNEEADLTGTVLKSAVRLVSGQASKTELAKELNEKLYGQRAGSREMEELGIDLVGPKGSLPASPSGGAVAGSQPAGKADGTTGQKPGEKPNGKPGEKPAAGTVATQKATVPGTSAAPPVSKPEPVPDKSKAALAEVWQRMKQYSVELSLVPVVFIGMVWVSRSRRRKREAGFAPEFMAVLPESDAEEHVMTHRVDSLSAEEFELLVALIYQRKGYRISLPAALAGGRSSRFKLARKSERLLAQCHNFKDSHRVEVELVRELHEAMADADVKGGLFVASCGYTWDARHFAKTRNIKLISAKTLDALFTEARATPDEDLLAITPWIQKFMTKVEMTRPHCPGCEAEMDEVKEGDGSAWLCNQRPECGGRRDVRKYRKGLRVAAQDAGIGADTAVAPRPASEGVAPKQCEPGQQPRSHGAAQRKATRPGETAGAVSTPPAARQKAPAFQPGTKVVTPEPASGAAQNGGKGTNAPAPTLGSLFANWKRDYLPELLRRNPKNPADPAQSEVAAGNAGEGSTAPPAASEQTDKPASLKPAPSKPVPVSVAGEPNEKSVEEGRTPRPAPDQQCVSQPAAETAKPKPAPDPVRSPRVPKNGGLLKSAFEDFKRRGFRSEEAPTARPKPAPSPLRGAGSGVSGGHR